MQFKHLFGLLHYLECAFQLFELHSLALINQSVAGRRWVCYVKANARYAFLMLTLYNQSGSFAAAFALASTDAGALIEREQRLQLLVQCIEPISHISALSPLQLLSAYFVGSHYPYSAPNHRYR